ncbi:hypothetical protein F4779DRAFT_577061 [Xylariaceae sp. FL0662B]|nr:hypothetical protein F4779DRAFT_577061 [Xylariaceae sp. FL0662B]
MDAESYDEFRRSMCQADPRLEKPNRSAASWHPWHQATPKVIALHLDPEGSFGPAVEYRDSDALQAHFHQRTHSENTPQRSVYILEALSREFVAVLGSHFHLHPTLFVDHERLVAFHNRATGEGGGLPFLPSAIYGRDHVSLKYHEPLLLSTLPTSFRNLCNVSGWHIAVTRIMGRFSEVGVARRKCTFWSRETEYGGWDCLIICDPAVNRVLTDYSGKTGYSVTTLPYNGGYIDFMPHRDQIESRSGPPRTSFLDDIIFYLQNHSRTLELAGPRSLLMLAEKVVANHYLRLSLFLQMVIEKMQFSLSRRQDLTSFAIAAAEEQWSDMQALQRRVAEYKDDLEAIMLQLRIPFDTPNPGSTGDWKDSQADYQFLYSRFMEINKRADGLNDSIATLAVLTNNRQAARTQELALEATERSVREAKSVKALTILGVVFVPLAYVATLFSMADSYKPGEELFWVYVAVAVPLIGLVVLGYYVLELEYTDGVMQWSFRAAITASKGNMVHRMKERV